MLEASDAPPPPMCQKAQAETAARFVVNLSAVSNIVLIFTKVAPDDGNGRDAHE
jgi:hypothetical protein